jgi:hypothetical protein
MSFLAALAPILAGAAPEIVAGGATLLGGLMSNRSASQTNRKDRQFSKEMYYRQLRDARRQYALQRGHSLQDYQTQRRDAIADYDRARGHQRADYAWQQNYDQSKYRERAWFDRDMARRNARDSYQWMVEGAQKAGLNPLTVMGVPPVSNATGASQMGGGSGLGTSQPAYGGISATSGSNPDFQMHRSSVTEGNLGEIIADAVKAYAAGIEDPIERESRERQNELTEARIKQINNEILRTGQQTGVPSMRSTETNVAEDPSDAAVETPSGVEYPGKEDPKVSSIEEVVGHNLSEGTVDQMLAGWIVANDPILKYNTKMLQKLIPGFKKHLEKAKKLAREFEERNRNKAFSTISQPIDPAAIRHKGNY